MTAVSALLFKSPDKLILFGDRFESGPYTKVAGPVDIKGLRSAPDPERGFERAMYISTAGALETYGLTDLGTYFKQTAEGIAMAAADEAEGSAALEQKFASDDFWIAWTNAHDIPEFEAASKFSAASWLAPMMDYDKTIDEGEAPLDKTEKASKLAQLKNAYYRVKVSNPVDTGLVKEGSSRVPLTFAWGEDIPVFLRMPKTDCCGGTQSKMCSEDEDCKVDDMLYSCERGRCKKNMFSKCTDGICFNTYAERETISITMESLEAAEKSEPTAYLLLKILSVGRDKRKVCEGSGEDRFCNDGGAGYAPIAKVVARVITDDNRNITKRMGVAPKSKDWKYNGSHMEVGSNPFRYAD